MSKREIEGSRAIVTGASSGIGYEIALELARRGAEVVVVARRGDRLSQLADRIAGRGGKVEKVVGDVTDPTTRQKAIDTVQSSFGGLDILVNSAGIGTLGLFEHSDPPRMRQVMEVNFFALVEMTRLALPLLLEGTNPIVVNIASILGHWGVPYNTEYCASKFAVRGFSESLRTELVRRGVDVLVVSPGTTDTEFFDSVIQRTGEPTWPRRGAVSAASVARKTVLAIRRGSHEIIPYRWGKILHCLNRLSPRLVNRIMARYT